jgi:hypothetical protein
MKINEILTEAVKQRLDKSCWKGYHKAGTKIKGDTRVNNCVPNESVEQDMTEGERTMSRAAKGNEKYGKDGMKALAKAGREGASEKELDAIRDKHDNYNEEWSQKYKSSINCSNPKGFSQKAHCAGKKKTEDITEAIEQNLNEQFDLIESWVESLAEEHGVDVDVIWEDFESVDDQDLIAETAAWQKKSGKNKNGGLNAKGVASYRSKLQTAVTTKPSKLKKGSKASKRRKSFCARMSGVKGPMKKPNGKPTRKALALRKWNC